MLVDYENENKKDVYDTDGSKAKYNEELNKYFNNKTIEAQTSKFGGYKYSQVIYSNNSLLNASISAYAGDSISLADDVKIKAFENYVGSNFFDFSNLTFKSSNGLSTEDAKKLDDAFVNFYFSSTFESETNK